MKSIKDLRENYNFITEKEEHDMNKLTQLVRAGLFDAKKLSALKRAMDKPADKMTAQEKRMMINLLDALMAEVLNDKMVYRKVKQDVMREAADWKNTEHLSGPDPKVKRFGYPSQKEAPTVLLLKRKAIRTFPDGQKVALYYAQAIDKYVSIPYNEIGINEEIELDEGLLKVAGSAWKYADDTVKATGRAIDRYKAGKQIKDTIKKAKAERRNQVLDRAARIKNRGKNPFGKNKGNKGGKLGAAGRVGAAAAGLASAAGSSGTGTNEPKYFTPMSSKLQANVTGPVTGPKKEGGSDAYQKRIEIANRKASEAMSRQANESVVLDGNIFEINNKVSSKVKSLYESLNKTNKKKMIEMMNESAESLEKVITFAVRQ